MNWPTAKIATTMTTDTQSGQNWISAMPIDTQRRR